jgi:hypothetical protein
LKINHQLPQATLLLGFFLTIQLVLRGGGKEASFVAHTVVLILLLVSSAVEKEVSSFQLDHFTWALFQADNSVEDIVLDLAIAAVVLSYVYIKSIIEYEI